jgi:cyclophilin family peptidyl-prolyl cis-trans isomerase
MKKLQYLVCILVLTLAAQRSSGGTLVQFRTTVGNIDVELYDQDKPATVQNFLRYVKGGYYTNNFFHRAIPHFVVQGGGMSQENVLDTNYVAGYNPVPTFPAITNEFLVGRRLSNTYGTIAMARSTEVNSATSQFFFNLADNSANLDNQNGGFTVFGHVVRGTNVLNTFNTRSKPTGGIVDLTAFYGPEAAILSDLPVTYLGNSLPRYEDLIYMDISLVNVQVKTVANQARQISWNSVNGVTNLVEYTTNFPPNWQLLATTNGNGNTLSVTDSSTNKVGRFYRVRVLY